MEELGEEDVGWLRETVARHQAETGSQLAKGLIDSWPKAMDQFVKVVPRDYKRVLDAIAEAEANGTDIVTAVMPTMGGS